MIAVMLDDLYQIVHSAFVRSFTLGILLKTTYECLTGILECLCSNKAVTNDRIDKLYEHVERTFHLIEEGLEFKNKFERLFPLDRIGTEVFEALSILISFYPLVVIQMVPKRCQLVHC